MTASRSQRFDAPRVAAIVVCIAFVLAGTVGVAEAASRSGVDRADGVAFRLHGRVLEVRLAPQRHHVPPDQRDLLWDHRVRAICGRDRRDLTYTTRRWPKTTTRLVFHFRRDVSRRARFCLLEDARDGGDIAAVRFSRRRSGR